MTEGKKPPKKKHPGKMSPSRILALEKERRALELRKAGANYDVIAQELSYHDASGARKAVQRAQQRLIREPAEEFQNLQLERYFTMLLPLWTKVQKGDEKAIYAALAVMERIDKLVGTESPAKFEHTHQGSVLVIEGSMQDYVGGLAKLVGVDPDEALQGINSQGINAQGINGQRELEAEIIEDEQVDEAEESPEDEQPHSSYVSSEAEEPAEEGEEVPFIPLDEEDDEEERE